ncbi:hypothetical protein PMAG_a0606 [Pseudoalteromonas mariniglutinosa NCIMB 1770]|nr:hypothetical protein [Pseudoalteromonas mariniglutinosa NCIMB 1770]
MSNCIICDSAAALTLKLNASGAAAKNPHIEYVWLLRNLYKQLRMNNPLYNFIFLLIILLLFALTIITSDTFNQKA